MFYPADYFNITFQMWTVLRYLKHTIELLLGKESTEKISENMLKCLKHKEKTSLYIK